MHRRSCADTSSKEREEKPAYPAKRPRLHSQVMSRSATDDRDFIDLSLDAPFQEGSGVVKTLEADSLEKSARTQPARTSGSRPLWGELEDPDPTGPPRWRHVRRRTTSRSSCLPDPRSCSDAHLQLDLPHPSPLQNRPRPWNSALRELASSAGSTAPPPQHLHMPQLPPAAASRRTASEPCPAEAAVPSPTGSRRELRARPPLPAISLQPPPPSSSYRSARDDLAQRLQARVVSHMARVPRSRSSADDDATQHLHDVHATELWPPPSEVDLARPSWSGWRAAFGSSSQEAPRSRGLSLTDMLGIFENEDAFPPPGLAPAGSQPASTAGRSATGGTAAHLHRPGRAGGHAAELRQLSALREVMMGAAGGSGSLPLHLLLSDRDFDENDYEALLALDENVESRKGASPAAISRIPTEVVRAAQGAAGGEVRCAICLEEYVPGALQRCLACTHRFHCACIDQWLGRKATCPICQRSCCD